VINELATGVQSDFFVAKSTEGGCTFPTAARASGSSPAILDDKDAIAADPIRIAPSRTMSTPHGRSSRPAAAIRSCSRARSTAVRPSASRSQSEFGYVEAVFFYEVRDPCEADEFGYQIAHQRHQSPEAITTDGLRSGGAVMGT